MDQNTLWSMIDTVMERVTETADEISVDDLTILGTLADQAMDLVNLVAKVQRTTEEN